MSSIYLNDFDNGEVKKKEYRFNRKKCLIYPEDPLKAKWDLYVTS